MSETIRLYSFTMSHFAEKARWALDRTGVEYREVVVMPGLHRKRLRGLGGCGHVPLLTLGGSGARGGAGGGSPSGVGGGDSGGDSAGVVGAGGRVFDGSSAIIDFADTLGGAPPLTPSDPALRAEALEWESYLDREVGETVRRVLYYRLFDHPPLLVRAWTLGAPFWAPPFYWLLRRRAVRVVSRAFDIDAANVQSDEQRLIAAFERVSERLAGRRFLVGHSFSRADLTLAALSAPLLRPSGHPWPLPELRREIPAVDALVRRLSDGAAARHVSASYATRPRDTPMGRCLRSVITV